MSTIMKRGFKFKSEPKFGLRNDPIRVEKMMYSAMIRIPPRSNCFSTVCFASTINSEQLRSQLDQLHAEAEITRTKGSNARLRLLRLSEAAEKIQRQAAIYVRSGKEDEARELLFQKKKIIQTLQKSKSRIELFDELSSKLNEAISLKETQLIGKVDLDIEVGGENASNPVRIVSPKEKVAVSSNECFDTAAMKNCDDQELQLFANRSVQYNNNDSEDIEGPGDASIWNENVIVHKLTVSSYENFLEHVDHQLSDIETELGTVLRLSTLVLESEEIPKNLKVRQIMELQGGIRDIRERIASIIIEKADVRSCVVCKADAEDIEARSG